MVDEFNRIVDEFNRIEREREREKMIFTKQLRKMIIQAQNYKV